MTEGSLNKFINSRYCFLLLFTVAAVFSYCTFRMGAGGGTVQDGLFFAAPERWLTPGSASWVVNGFCIAFAGLVFFLLCKTFAFIREYTVIYMTLFAVFVLFNPDASSALNSSSVMAAVLVLCTFILFNNFQRADKRSAVFLVTFILTVCSSFCQALIFYIPIFAVGFMQMQLFSFKGFLAMLAGIAVPVAVSAAFGIIEPSAYRMPVFFGGGFLTAFSDFGCIRLLAVVAIGTVFGTANVLTLMSYRLQLRAYNGFLNVMAIGTLLLAAADLQHPEIHFVTLAMLASVQAAHFFTIRKFRRSYLLFAAIILVEMALSVADVFELKGL